MDIFGNRRGAAAGRHARGISSGPATENAMNASRVKLPGLDPELKAELKPELKKEQRLHEIRREAEQHGKMAARGIRPSGAPFPMASAETGYYGIPLLKEPPW